MSKHPKSVCGAVIGKWRCTNKAERSVPDKRDLVLCIDHFSGLSEKQTMATKAHVDENGQQLYLLALVDPDNYSDKVRGWWANGPKTNG